MKTAPLESATRTDVTDGQAVILDISWPSASSTSPAIEYEIVNVADWPPDEALRLG